MSTVLQHFFFFLFVHKFFRFVFVFVRCWRKREKIYRSSASNDERKTKSNRFSLKIEQNNYFFLCFYLSWIGIYFISSIQFWFSSFFAWNYVYICERLKKSMSFKKVCIVQAHTLHVHSQKRLTTKIKTQIATAKM